MSSYTLLYLPSAILSLVCSTCKSIGRRFFDYIKCDLILLVSISVHDISIFCIFKPQICIDSSRCESEEIKCVLVLLVVEFV